MLRAGRYTCCALVLLAGCTGGGGADEPPSRGSTSARSAPGVAIAPGSPDVDPGAGDVETSFGGVDPSCDPTRAVRADSPALLVTDPSVLASFSLERLMDQLLRLGGVVGEGPEAAIQRLFDMENTAAEGAFADIVHCDEIDYEDKGLTRPVDCPRAEGALARSKGLFEPGHPDYFAPVAIVSRPDLALSDFSTCGEFRIVYAKQSGKVDPANRVFLIFEGVLPNPVPFFDVGPCWSIVQFLANLEGKGPDDVRRALERLYFTGLGAFEPVIDPHHFGGTGRVRLSERMQEPWRFRQAIVFAGPTENPVLRFLASELPSNPSPERFDRDNTSPEALEFRKAFAVTSTKTLGASSLVRVRFPEGEYGSPSFGGAVESALTGDAQPSYRARATGQVGAAPPAARSARPALLEIDRMLERSDVGAGCPDDDPLTAEHILNRATTQSCAGCHAPGRFLGASRSIGCGLTWPDSLGGVHVDEAGTLSPAMTEVFLPHRAKVMSTWSQACDWSAVSGLLQFRPPKTGAIPPEGAPELSGALHIEGLAPSR